MSLTSPALSMRFKNYMIKHAENLSPNQKLAMFLSMARFPRGVISTKPIFQRPLPRYATKVLGVKRNRNNNNPIKKSNVSGAKRRKVHAPYRYACSGTNAINRLRNQIGDSVHQLFVKDEGIIGDTTDKRNKSYYLILILKYSEKGTHVRHAISAVRVGGTLKTHVGLFGKVVTRVGGTLFVFDPWGSDRKKITDSVASDLRKKLDVKKVYIYNGKNLQARNSKGVCLGFASDFLVWASRSARINSSTLNANVYNFFKNAANEPNIMAKGSLMKYENPSPQEAVPRRT